MIGPRIELRVDEVHGHAAHLDAVIEGLPLRVKTGKSRQQRRMDVQNAFGNASSSGAPTRRMNPARQTSPTPRACSSRASARS